jgi:hypothetical protein
MAERTTESAWHRLRTVPRGDLVIIVVAVLALLVAVIAMTASTAAIVASSHPGRASTASNAHFRAGEIISDAQFYNPDTMTVAEVQRFLEKQRCTPEPVVPATPAPATPGPGTSAPSTPVAPATPMPATPTPTTAPSTAAPAPAAPCLADYRQDTPDKQQDYAHCAAYRGGASQSAAQIVVGVAQACRINPQVLLVLLQKEQSLITHPTTSGYQKAMGYACPDTAPCDTEYFGFFNQVYNAAWQFREYTVNAPDFRYNVGKVAIQYNPNPTCGSSVVDIRDQATANLYNYTPYQPSPSTIAGAQDDCSSFGNLNFWKLYTEWFGSPLTQPFPAQFAPCLNLIDGRRCDVDPVTGL